MVADYPEAELTGAIIAAAIEVHRELGPGLLESAYQCVLELELGLRGVSFASQVSLPIKYKGITVDAAYRVDLLIESRVVVEIKAAKGIDPVHEAQILTYLRLMKLPVGLIINFNVPRLVDGVTRKVLTLA